MTVTIREHQPEARYRGIAAACDTLAGALEVLHRAGHIGTHTCAVILTSGGRYSPSVNITSSGRGADDHSRSRIVSGSTLSVPEGCAAAAQEIIDSLDLR